ncbi:MAG: PD-(D/E)XK nuclease family protein [Planctomycetota bacterium]
MPDLENTFSWSLSRHRTFQDCPRRYWYHYYGSWGGWAPDAPAEARELYLLKNITNFDLAAGDCVHRAIERALQQWARGVATDPEQAVAWCKQEMQRALEESRAEAWRENPKRCTRFFEHHYGPPPDRATLERVAAKVGTSVRGFFGSAAYARIRETDPADWLPIEKLDSFVFEGTKVFAVPDFACRSDGEVILFDWKTGRRDDRNDDQVALYTLFAVAKWGADASKVRGAPVYLLEGGPFEPQRITPGDLDRVGALVRSSIEAMRSRLSDAAANVALREAYGARPGAVCRRCPFRGVCPDAR